MINTHTQEGESVLVEDCDRGGQTDILRDEFLA